MTEVASTALTGWDWFVVLVLLSSMLLGLWRGLIRTVFGLAAWVVALIGAPLLSPMVIASTAMEDHAWVVFVVLFLGLFLTVRVVGWLLARAIGKVGLGGVDRLLGGALGVARATLLILIAALAAHSMKLDQTAAWRLSHSRPLLDLLVELGGPYLPQRISGIRET